MRPHLWMSHQNLIESGEGKEFETYKTAPRTRQLGLDTDTQMSTMIPSSFTTDLVALEDVTGGPKHPGVKGWDIDRQQATHTRVTCGGVKPKTEYWRDPFNGVAQVRVSMPSETIKGKGSHSDPSNEFRTMHLCKQETKWHEWRCGSRVKSRSN